MNSDIEINGNMELSKHSPLEQYNEDVMEENIDEKAVSKSQQRFFGMVDAYKKGELDNPSKSVKDAADGMSMKQVKDFAKTKHKGLPNHVDESTLRKIIKNVLKEVYEIDDDEPTDDGDDENYIDSAQYIFDLYVNGNKTEAALEMARAPKSKLIDVFRIAREAGDEEGIQQLYAYTDTDKFKDSQYLEDEHNSNAALRNYLSKNFNLQEKLNELSNDTIDNAYMKVLNDVNTLPYGTPKRVRRDCQLKNMKDLRNDKLGFDPIDMSSKMRQYGTSGNPTIDRKWATWQQNHDDRVSGKRTYDASTGRWRTHLSDEELDKIIKETVQTHLVDVLGKYTQGKTSSKEANKAIMDLANSSNMNERNNRGFSDYASEYFEKHGEKLPDDVLKKAAEKNDNRFHGRKVRDGKYSYVPQRKDYNSKMGRLNESYAQEGNYTHFAVNKQTNKIVNGWDYSEHENSQLKQYAKDYFIRDLIDYGLDPKQYTILTRVGCKKRGINPDDDNQWANT